MDVAEFERIVRIGLGRAVLHLQTHDPGPYRDVIMEATLHNWQFDTEESTRERYMLELIELSGDPDPFRNAILNSLESLTRVDEGSLPYRPDTWDARQLCAIARQLAKGGDAEAHQVLRRVITHHPANDYLVSELLDLEGEEGVLFLAGILGARLESDVEHPEWDCAHAFHSFEFHIGEDRTFELLTAAAKSSPQIAAFVALVKAEQTEPEQPRLWSDAKGLDYEELLGWMTDKSRSRYRTPYPWITWGRHTEADELQRAADALLTLADDDPLLLRHVQVFGGRPFPLDPQRLVDLARRGQAVVDFDRSTGSHEDILAVDALFALGNIRHPSVRSFALELIAEERWLRWSTDLLLANFEEGDLAVINETILKTSDPGDLHHMMMTLNDFIRENRPPGIEETMLLCYEHGPCGFCRWSIVKDFLEARSLPEWVKTECRFDANTEIRELFKA